MASPGNYYFYIVNRFDSLIYENEFLKANITNPDKKVYIFFHKQSTRIIIFSMNWIKYLRPYEKKFIYILCMAFLE